MTGRLIDAVPALLAERDAAVAEATRARFENERLISAIRSAWMRQTDALKAERDEARREVAQYRGAICFEQTCLSCADMLDRCYSAEAERDEARREAEQLRAEAKLHALCNDGCVPGAAYRMLTDELDAALARVEAVRALHAPGDCACDPSRPHRTGKCRQLCRGDWPCATLRALDAGDGRTGDQE